MWSLRTRLVHGFLAALAATGLVSTFVGAYLIERGITEQALDKARLDLNSARLVFSSTVGDVRNEVELAATSRVLVDGASGADVGAELERLRVKGGLDFLDLLDAKGTVLVRARHADGRRDNLAHNPVIGRVLGGDGVVAAVVVMSPDELEREAPELRERARVAVVAGPEAGARPRDVTSGLVILAAAELAHPSGERRGALVGGVLLNRDDRLVDRIRETVYEGETYQGRPVGEGTICLGDVRIATSLTAGNGRAVGTLVDPLVRQRVLELGTPRVDRADVLGESHFTAYDPLRDATGKTVGMLSLGISARRYTELREEALLFFLVVSLGGLCIALFIGTFIARRMSHPIGALAAAVKDVGAGNLAHRVEPTHVIEEFEVLAEGFNKMAAALEERDLQLKFRTQEQLGKAERLAMIGRLAAGVAHEINNPLAGIMLFSSLLLRKAPAGTPEHESLERICNETKRCQVIVQGLLDFARRREPKLEVKDLHEVIDTTLQLVHGQALFQNVHVVRAFDAACPRVRIDAAQIQQVLLNLVVNAAEAMGGRGQLTIATRPEGNGGGLRLEVTDTGCGISADNLEHLFEPFFTTKDVGRGTGLGLSISRGIVENHGGAIWASSTVGQGTTFSVRLPAAEAAVA